MEADAAMLIPQNRNPSAGRAVMPAKSSTPTPQRTGSATRVTSSGRKASSAHRYDVVGSEHDVNKHIVDQTSKANRVASRSGAVSRRKLHRWEMDNLFGIAGNTESSRAVLFPDDDDDEGGIRNFGLTIDWRCLFSELFRGKNDEARASFLACEDSIYQAPRFASRFNKLSEEVKAGEVAWLRVPKKLRPVLQRAVEEDADIKNSELGPIEYLRALESAIFYFVDTGHPAPVTALPKALTERLAEPLLLSEAPASFARQQTTSGSDDEDGWVHVNPIDAVVSPPETPHMGLRIVLEESPLHRLFLYAIVQFHGLQTRSYDADGQRCDNGVRQERRHAHSKKVKTSYKKKPQKNQPSVEVAPNTAPRKAILIYRGQNALKTLHGQPMRPQDRLSLVSYLQYKQSQRDEAKMQLLMRQMSLTGGQGQM